jgi:hypothetical protein
MKPTTPAEQKLTYEELEALLADTEKQLVIKTSIVQELARQNAALEQIVLGFAKQYIEANDAY